MIRGGCRRRLKLSFLPPHWHRCDKNCRPSPGIPFSSSTATDGRRVASVSNADAEWEKEMERPLRDDEIYPRYISKTRHMSDWSDTWRPYTPERSDIDSTVTPNGVKQKQPSIGHTVPYKFNVIDDRTSHSLGSTEGRGDRYTDFVGNRFPTLSASGSYRMWRPTGLAQFIPRPLPVAVDPDKKLDPLFRSYIFFLHNADPHRFTVRRVAERYGMKLTTVRAVVATAMRDWWLATRKLVSRSAKIGLRIKEKEKVANAKAEIYGELLGYDQMGDEEDLDDDLDVDGFKGHTSTFDPVRLQAIHIEAMSAYPLPQLRDPLFKRVDVDVTVKESKDARVINWINPIEKVVF